MYHTRCTPCATSYHTGNLVADLIDSAMSDSVSGTVVTLAALSRDFPRVKECQKEYFICVAPPSPVVYISHPRIQGSAVCVDTSMVQSHSIRVGSDVSATLTLILSSDEEIAVEGPPSILLMIQKDVMTSQMAHFRNLERQSSVRKPTAEYKKASELAQALRPLTMCGRGIGQQLELNDYMWDHRDKTTKERLRLVAQWNDERQRAIDEQHQRDMELVRQEIVRTAVQKATQMRLVHAEPDEEESRSQS